MASLIPRPAPIKCSVIQTQGQAELGGAAARFSIREQRSHTIALLKRSQVPTTDSTGESEGGSMQIYV